MNLIKLIPEDDVQCFLRIMANAYPGMNLSSSEDLQRVAERLKGLERDPNRALYGYYRDGQLIGGMILYDFRMNMYGTMMPAGGVGQVAVDLLHKKEKVAKEMISFFARHYLERDVSILLLYPFRPDFYKKMGFGFGAKISQYRLRTAAFPRAPGKKQVRFAQPPDKEAILACYERNVAKTHGMISRDGWEVDRHFESPTTNIVVVERDDRVFGYVVFTFDRGETFLDNQLRIIELIYEDAAALSEILTFLSTQADQVEWTVLPSHDDLLHHLVDDPRNDTGHLIPSVYHETNTQGVGLMYRVINAAALFRRLHAHDFGGESLKVQITLVDSFLPDQEGSITVNFERGRANVTEGVDHDVAIRLDIADFSSLMMGVIPFSRLHHYGLVEISDPAYVAQVERLFWAQHGPVCLTSF